MSLSIKIPEEKKQKLEMLQARILDETGQKIDFQTLLGMAVDLSVDEFENLLARILRMEERWDDVELETILKDVWEIADVPLIEDRTDDELIYGI